MEAGQGFPKAGCARFEEPLEDYQWSLPLPKRWMNSDVDISRISSWPRKQSKDTARENPSTMPSATFCPDSHGEVLDVGCGIMPYKNVFLSQKAVSRYIGLDFAKDEAKHEFYASVQPDLTWNGTQIPLPDHAVDSVVATEVLEHCPDPNRFLSEVFRVLKPGGIFFFTVPFLWPLHDVPFDEYRYTPFALKRHLETAGLHQVQLRSLGGWDATLAQMLGLWISNRPIARRPLKRILMRLILVAIPWLLKKDALQPKDQFGQHSMMTGLYGTAIKP